MADPLRSSLILADPIHDPYWFSLILIDPSWSEWSVILHVICMLLNQFCHQYHSSPYLPDPHWSSLILTDPHQSWSEWSVIHSDPYWSFLILFMILIDPLWSLLILIRMISDPFWSLLNLSDPIGFSTKPKWIQNGSPSPQSPLRMAILIPKSLNRSIYKKL